MSASPKVAGSSWFACLVAVLVAVLVALGAQTLLGAVMPLSAMEWLYDKPPPDPVVLVAGETSFWRLDALMRALSFALGAWVACLIARSPSWRLLASLVAASLVATALAQFPRPATAWQLGLWTLAAPVGVLLAGVLVRAWRTDA